MADSDWEEIAVGPPLPSATGTPAYRSPEGHTVITVGPSNSYNDDEWETVAVGAPAPKQPSMGGAETFAGGMSDLANKMSFGAGDEIIAGGNALLDALSGNSLSQSYDERLNQVRGLMGGYQQEHPYSSGANNLAALLAPVPGIFSKAKGVVPALGNIGKGIGVGAGYGGTAGFLSGQGDVSNRLEDALRGAEWGGAIGGAGQGLAETLQGTANFLPEAGRKLELSAFGATKAKISRAINRMPNVLDDQGDFQNPISRAIGSFRSEGGGKSGISGEALLGDLETQTKKHVRDLRDVLSEAQSKQSNAIIPEFKKTQSYIDGLAGTDKAKAAEIAQEEITNTINNTDGNLLSLQDEKVKLGNSIADSSWGQDAAGRLKNNILKRIRADLRTTVEDQYQILTGKDKAIVSNLNEKIGQRQGLRGLFKDMLAHDEARNPLNWLMQNWKTSGGFGTAALLAGHFGGIPAGVAVPLIGGAIASPGGRAVTSDILRSDILQKALQGTSKGVGLGRSSLPLAAIEATVSENGSVRSPSDSLSLQTGIAAKGSPRESKALVPQVVPNNRRKPREEQKSNQGRQYLESQNSYLDRLPTPPPTQAKKQNISLVDDAMNRAEAVMNAKSLNLKKEDVDLSKVRRIEKKIDSDPLDKTMYEFESSRDPLAKNPESSAEGAFQLLKGTAKALGVKNRLDIEESYNGYQKLKAENRDRFGEDPAVLYSAHYLGATVLSKVLKSQSLTKDERERVAYLQETLLPRFLKLYKKNAKSIEV